MEFGLIGEKISYSISPQIHRMIFRLMGIDARYRLMPVACSEIPGIGRVLRRMSGVNITIPYKRTFMSLCDGVSSEAQRIGAINTIACRDGRLYGHNTDYYGFGKMAAFVGYTSARPPDVCAVLGSGGASLAVVRYLEDIGAKKIFIVSRTPDKSAPAETIGYDKLAELQGDLLVNATPVGTFPNIEQSPVPDAVVRKFCAALDLVYNPNPTSFLQIAQRSGLKTCSGLLMLVGQAVKSEEIWQGKEIPDAVADAVYAEMKMLLENKK